jgi:hypothetical protein
MSSHERTYVLLHELPAMLFGRVFQAAQCNAPALTACQVHRKRVNPLRLATVRQPCDDRQLAGYNLRAVLSSFKVLRGFTDRTADNGSTRHNQVLCWQLHMKNSSTRRTTSNTNEVPPLAEHYSATTGQSPHNYNWCTSFAVVDDDDYTLAYMQHVEHVCLPGANKVYMHPALACIC